MYLKWVLSMFLEDLSDILCLAQILFSYFFILFLYYFQGNPVNSREGYGTIMAGKGGKNVWETQPLGKAGPHGERVTCTHDTDEGEDLLHSGRCWKESKYVSPWIGVYIMQEMVLIRTACF